MQLLRFLADGARNWGVRGGLAVLLAGLPASLAEAQARPYAPSMTCSQVAGLVSRQGAAVISTGPNTFDRYVRDIAFCAGGEQVQPEWISTRDVAKCFIGYTCYTPSREDMFGR